MENGGQANAVYTVDENKLIVRLKPIDGAVQVVVPHALWSPLLYHSHYPVTAGHSRQRRMYDSVRIGFYWSHTANNVSATVRSCSACARNWVEHEPKRKLQLYRASGPLKFILIDILGALPRTVDDNQYVIAMTDRYSKLTRALSTSQASFAHVVNVFFDSSIIPDSIPAYVLADTGVQCTNKLFATLCAMIRVKHLTTTDYHPQTNGQVERYNRTIGT